MSWFDKDFKRRMPLMVNTSTTPKGSYDFHYQVPEDWDDFWDNVLVNGYDVVITDKSGARVIFERFTWNHTTRQGFFRVANATAEEANVMHVIYIYWNNPDQIVDFSSSVTTTSPKIAHAFLGSPYKNIVNLGSNQGLSTTPTTIIQKEPSEKIDIWFPVSQILSPRALPYNERLDYKSVSYIETEVVNSSNINQPTMYALEETRIIAGWIKLRIQDGAADTDYVVRAIIKNNDNEVYILSCLLQVRQLLPS